MSDLGIVPAPADAEPYIELASSGARRFRKHILNLGPLVHPKTGKVLNLGDEFYATLKRNWDAKVCPIIQFPAADDGNKHTEDPLRNLGQVTNLSREGSKVYVDLEVPDDATADKVGKTVLGASAFLHMDHQDARTGRKVGPTLLHVCATNRPYVVDLEPYEEVVATTAPAGWTVFQTAACGPRAAHAVRQ